MGAYGSEAPAQDLRGRPTKAVDSEEEEEVQFKEELKKWKKGVSDVDMLSIVIFFLECRIAMLAFVWLMSMQNKNLFKRHKTHTQTQLR